MYLKYGTYSHAANECQLVITRNRLLSEGGVPFGYTERWDVSGMLFAASVSALTTAITALEAAYSRDYRDVALYEDGGTVTSHRMVTGNSFSGVRVVQRPSFPVGNGAEYTTYRSYSLALEATFQDTTTSMLQWAEAITQEGAGGPAWDFLVPLQGQPQAQTFTQRTPITIRQEGYAVGNGAYPLFNGPLLPAYEQQERRSLRRELPSFRSAERRCSWSYTFRVLSAPNLYPTTHV